MSHKVTEPRSTFSLPGREYEDGEDVSDEADAADGEGEDAVAPVPRAAPRRHVLHHVL